MLEVRGVNTFRTQFSLGGALGWLERLPNRDLVQAVRDVYIALNYAAGGYHVLYARAVLLERPAATGLALRHLRDYTPAIRRLSQLLAWAAALDLPLERWHGKRVMNEVVEALLDSWSSDGVEDDAHLRATPSARTPWHEVANARQDGDCERSPGGSDGVLEDHRSGDYSGRSVGTRVRSL